MITAHSLYTMPRSGKTQFLGHAARAENGCVYYHAFSVGGTVFGPLRYCRFAYAGVNYFGKIHSCWEDTQSVAMAEVQPFRYRKNGHTFPQDQTAAYREVVAVVGECMEIPISSILPDSALVCWVPHTITPGDGDRLFDYVESNMGRPEHQPTDDDSDDSDDDSDDDFIVDGDVFAWYQFAVNGGSTAVRLAPPPQFVDLWMTYEPPSPGEAWYEQQFPRYVFNEFFKDRFAPLAPSPGETMTLLAQVDKGVAPKLGCPVKDAELRWCGMFVADLKRGLNGDMDAYTLYNLCVDFKERVYCGVARRADLVRTTGPDIAA